MTRFLDLLNYYNLYQADEDLKHPEIISIAGVNPKNDIFCQKTIKEVEQLKTHLAENPESDIQDFKTNLNLSQKSLDTCLMLIEIAHPGLVKKKHLDSLKRGEIIDDAKLRKAISIARTQFDHDHEIAQELGVPIIRIKECKDNLPALKNTHEFELLRQENRVREFFSIYPYSTISEASRALKLTGRQTRVIVEDLIAHGETVLYNNIPRPIDYEERKLKIVQMKKNDPGLSDNDISQALGISVSQVRQAIADTIRLWQIEKASSYDFYFAKSMQELSTVKEEALRRHNASNQSSSRWLEIFLIAEEKQIKLLGLNAPEKIDIRKEVRVTKQERDSVVEAFMATESIDVDFKKVQVTGSTQND